MSRLRRRGGPLALALALGLLALPAAANARSANIVDANVHLRLAPDSSLLVTERLSFDYDGTFEGSYRDINLLHGERITDISLSENGRPFAPGGNTTLGSHDAPGKFGAESESFGARVVWHFAATDEKRTWVLRYRVIDGAVAYDDVIDVLWAVWGNQWDFDLDHLHADLKNPALVPSNPDYRVWGHPRGVSGETSRDPGVARLVASDVDSGTAVELRVTVPRRPGQNLSGARIGKGDGLPAILAKEQGLTDDYNSSWNRFKRFIGDNANWICALFVLLQLLMYGVFRIAAREHDVGGSKYEPGPPDAASPALGYALAHEGDASDDTVLATLLDLTDRDFYDTKQEGTEKEKLDLAISKPSKRPSAEKLEPYEKEVLDFFDELIGDGTVPFSKMKDKIPEHSSSWRTKWESMTAALGDADEGEIEWDRSLNGVFGLLSLALMGIVLGISLIYAADRDLILPPILFEVPMLGILIAGLGNSLKRVDIEHRKRTARWEAFERWTKDFPRLKDDPPATLELWKKILVFGVAFGTAKRMIDSGRIPAPVSESSSSGGSNAWAGYMLAGNYDNHSFGEGFSSGFASQVAPESSSSGGGGGFSGGGGGGSGGGGGGSW